MRTRIVVSAIIEKDGKFLFGRKAPGIGPYPDTWHLLGGGVDLENETLQEAMRRELLEEAGIQVGELKPIMFDEQDSPNKNGEITRYVFHVYRCEYKSGELTPGDDIARIEWFDKADLTNIPLPPPSQRVFTSLGWI